MMLSVSLTQGFVARIDDVDADLSDHKWFASLVGTPAYAVRDVGGRLNKKRLLMHRVIAERMGLDLSGGKVVDHINGDCLDNRRCNLRAVTRMKNAHNLTGERSNNTSGYMGVSFDARYRRKWVASIYVDYKKHIVGRFDSAEEANVARLAAEKRLWGIEPRRAEAHA
jgi:hypothetical protein